MKRTKLKNIARTGAAAGLLASLCLTVPVQAQSNDALLDALVRKGLLTQQEADQVRQEAQQKAEAEAAKTANNVQFYWKDGLRFQSADGKTFKGKLGGRIQADVATFIENGGVGPVDTATEFRRVRLYTEGEFQTSVPVFYKLQLDFAGADVAFKDVFLGLADLPVVGSLKLGHFKEPIGLEELTSSKYITFMERATPIEAFAPSRNTGVSIGDAVLDQRMTWALGAFTDTSLAAGDDEGVLSSDYRVSARLTGLPWYDAESKGSRLLHVGLSGSVASPENDSVSYRSRPEAHLANRLVDTGGIPADHTYTLGAEAALVYGPLSLQGEFLQTWVDGKMGDNPCFFGLYGFASFFLTGEHRAYKTSAGTFDRVKPKSNFSLDGSGLGAWEAAVRYSHLDLNDGGYNGGRLNDITAGLNWYLNPNARVMFNYVFADLGGRGALDGELHGFMSRFQVDF